MSNFYTLLMYSLFTFSFVSQFMVKSNCSTPKYLCQSRLTSLICFPSGNSTPFVRTILPLIKTSTSHLSRPNTMPTSEKLLTVWISESSSLSLFAYSFKSSINKRWFNFWFLLVTYPSLVSFKIISKGIRTTNQRWKRNPLKDYSYPNINFSKTFIIYYQLCSQCLFAVSYLQLPPFS